jgi:endoglucanase
MVRGLMLALALIAAPLLAESAQAEIPAAGQTAAMGRGVNIIGYDPLWRDPARARFQERHMQVIREGGFSTVRINLHAFDHMDAQHRLSPQFLATLDRMIHAALAVNLTVILDEHDFIPCGQDAAACRPRLMAFWEQISERYKGASDPVVFEILNEPNQAMNEPWNDVLAETLAIIRRTNPTRNVIVGPAFWNNIDWLDRLRLPKNDRHLIVTVHYYLPMEFTHQGASWTPQFKQLGVRWGSDAERATLRRHFEAVHAWSKANDRPILLGEFGAYDRAPLDSRIAYTTAVAREAERHGWAWTYWQFDSDFIAYHIEQDRWNEPIYRALIPEAPALR